MAEKIDFEKSLKALEDIVARLEKGECTLEESIELFESGMTNIKACQQALSSAEQKIKTLGE